MARTSDRDSRALLRNLGASHQDAPRGPRRSEGAWTTQAMRNMDAILPPSRQDATQPVPWGFGKYIPPTINPADYNYFQAGAWRIAVPRGTDPQKRHDLVTLIFNYGPKAAGYVQVGDTLVPWRLSPGDRQMLASVGSSRNR